MVKIEKLSYGFPAKDLYNDISFEIERGQHCALIGSNGCGKSTPVDMIIDPEEYLYDGKIINDCFKHQYNHLNPLKMLTSEGDIWYTVSAGKMHKMMKKPCIRQERAMYKKERNRQYCITDFEGAISTL